MINTKLQPTRVKYVAPKDQIQMWRIVRGDEVNKPTSFGGFLGSSRVERVFAFDISELATELTSRGHLFPPVNVYPEHDS
jgi:hypothetical protein